MNILLIKNLVLSPLVTAFFISLLTTPLVIFLYRRWGWVEDPVKDKTPKTTHTQPVPRGGGIPIFLALLVGSLVFLPLDKHLQGILIGVVIMTLMGIFDDRFNLNPYLRLFLCFLAAGAVVGAGIGIAFITNPFNGLIQLDQPQIQFQLLGKMRSLWLMADLFALLWIVGLSNIVDWAKGFDGQLPGIVVIAGLTIALLALKFSADITQWPVAILASITAGAYLGFLPFNFYPQKIMPGYGGGILAGFMLAVLAILSTTKVGTAIVVLGVPIIDALYSITRRLLTKRSPVWGDRGHLHHKLLDEWRWGKRRAALFFWTITAFLGALALGLNSQGKFYTIIMLGVLIGGLFLWFNFLSIFFIPPDRDKRSKISL
ncbi:MAG: undecaprenyl/decaprenyl-phosphate alpha-N-acetylglucosaminyl 1-phosphate transferase [Candidatus Marinimicrobia bacterium]|nr:undecaprenyl/decaprenyl-phosphate alpha-N-acetylglucosaminyl 1-phosphate transferase [Candidatus Neomarinimicrobiota bacterium]